jgi:DNA repair exonuclease SbcCD ATPase subunit
LIDLQAVLVSILLIATIGVAVECYRILRKAQKEYEEARETVEDIVLSFNRQLQSESEKFETAAYRLEALSSKVDGASKNVGEIQKTVRAIEPKVASALEDKEKVSTKLEEFDKKVQELATSQSTFVTRVSILDEQVKQFLAPEPNVQAVIPIKRDRALAPLTVTELSALEILASEGPKTAPEIRGRVKLSREHTARLMKKLYEGGYLERDTNKIPFKYSVKKEMEALLKKTESGTT